MPPNLVSLSFVSVIKYSSYTDWHCETLVATLPDTWVSSAEPMWMRAFKPDLLLEVSFISPSHHLPQKLSKESQTLLFLFQFKHYKNQNRKSKLRFLYNVFIINGSKYFTTKWYRNISFFLSRKYKINLAESKYKVM